MRLIFFTFIAALVSATAQADNKRLIPLNSLVFNPTNFSVDTSGETHADPSLWQAGPNGIYTGRGDSLKDYRVSTDSEGVVTAIAHPDMLKPDAGWMSVLGHAATFQGYSPDLSKAPYVAAVTLDKDHRVISQTQCMQGSCLTITAKACEKFKTAAKATGYDDLVAKIQACNDLRSAWENSGKDKDVAADVNAAFAKDRMRISKSAISNWSDKPLSGWGVLNLQLTEKADLSFARTVQQLFVEGCRTHFSPGAASANAGGNGDSAVIR